MSDSGAAPPPFPPPPGPHGPHGPPRPPGPTPPAGPPADPGARPDGGRAPSAQAAAYIVSGVLLIAFAGGVIAWIVDGLRRSQSDVTDLLRAMFQPSHPIDPALLMPHEWAFAVALLTVGVLALCQRRAARGGALLLAAMLLALCLRQCVGLLDAEYRDWYSHGDYGPWLLTTYGAGLVIAAVVLILLLLAPDEPGRSTDNDLTGPDDPAARKDAGPTPGPMPWRPIQRERRAVPFPLGGALLVALGLVHGAWAVDRQLLADEAGYFPFSDYLRDLVDPSNLHTPGSLGNGIFFYEAALIVAMIATGVLALLGLRVARGAGLTVLGIAAFLEMRTVVARFEAGHWDAYFDSTRGTLTIVSMVFTATATLTTIVVLLIATGGRRDVRSVV